jgi:predicted NBD/HSP70 family sugar kinase
VQLPTKATHRQTREHNTRLVLRTLSEAGRVSRADIARRTRLTRTTVSDVVAGLMDVGLVEEVGRGPSSGGKAPILLRIPPDARHVIGLDLGEGAFAGALVDLRGDVRREIRVPLEGRDGEEALTVVHDLVAKLMRTATSPLLGIGVGTPGIVDTRSGTIRWAVNLDWQDLPLARLLTERHGLPAVVANDSRAAALAAYTFAPGSRGRDLVAIKVGRGVGAGIVLRGELLLGDGSSAGEIGHVRVVEDGRRCRCGNVGCLETIASAAGIVAVAGQLAARTPGCTLARAADAGTLDLDQVRAAWAADDPAATTAVLEAGRALGRVIAGLEGVLDIHRIVLHGSVTAFGARWLEAVRAEAHGHTLPTRGNGVEISLVDLDADLVLLGASAMLMTSQLGMGLAR